MKLRYKICISGGAEGISAVKAQKLAQAVGQEIAKRGHVLITGATHGVPWEAALAAKKAGGTTIGFSPAGSEEEHLRKYRLPDPNSVYDHVIYAESGYTGRNMLMVRSSDATICIDGRIGTLNEFTVAFEENEIVGVLEGSGGVTDVIRAILEVADKGTRRVVFETDPIRMVDLIVAKITEEKLKKNLIPKGAHKTNLY